MCINFLWSSNIQEQNPNQELWPDPHFRSCPQGLFNGNFSKDPIVSKHYSNELLQHVSLYVWLQNYDCDIKSYCCRKLSLALFYFYIHCMNTAVYPSSILFWVIFYSWFGVIQIILLPKFLNMFSGA